MQVRAFERYIPLIHLLMAMKERIGGRVMCTVDICMLKIFIGNTSEIKLRTLK